MNNYDIERFWVRVNKQGPLPVDKPCSGRCWVYGGKDSTDYGTFTPSGQKGQRAHRVSFEMAKGRPIEQGKIICHKCDNKRCVNPDHLYEGTYAQNSIDVSERGKGRTRGICDIITHKDITYRIKDLDIWVVVRDEKLQPLTSRDYDRLACRLEPEGDTFRTSLEYLFRQG